MPRKITQGSEEMKTTISRSKKNCWQGLGMQRQEMGKGKVRCEFTNNSGREITGLGGKPLDERRGKG